MKRHAQSGTRLGRFCRRAFWENTAASQIAEFAVSLPLLVVFIVGIFDFGTAFTLKQKLGTATQEAARVAANQVTNDLSTTSPLCNGPASICSLRDTVANSLQSSNVPRCGLDSANATQTGLTTWTFSAGTGCTGTLLLTINRGFTYTTNLSAPFPICLIPLRPPRSRCSTLINGNSIRPYACWNPAPTTPPPRN
jgi:Flp pilus assembly protein TadG